MRQSEISIDKILKTLQDVSVSVAENGLSEAIVRHLIGAMGEMITRPHATAIQIMLPQFVLTSDDFKPSTAVAYAPIQFNNQSLGQVELHYQDSIVQDADPEAARVDQDVINLIAAQLGMLVMIAAKDAEILVLKEEAMAAYDSTIEAWAAAFDSQQKEASGHTARVTNLALALAREMGFPEEELVHIRRGALLHDIGKISIPDEIISKPGKLTDEEFAVVKRSPLFAKKWLSQIEMLKPALQIPYYHHEKWDGTGYPLGLSGEAIPLAARMFSIVDVWDALTSDRPYRQALSKEEALNLIVSQSGAHFDPRVVERFVQVLSKEKYIDTPHQLRIQAFGAERVWSQNILITTSEWQVHAARELFFFFLSHPEGLTKEQIGLYLWPDASNEELDIRFKNTLYRLRSAVGKHIIILTEGIYRFNPILDYTYDVEIFESAIEHAQEAQDVNEQIKHLSRAVKQYKGDYLPEVDAFWAIPDRERFRLMNINALVSLATLYFEKGVYKSALRYCGMTFREDSVNEAAYRIAMQTHAILGNQAEVVRHYDLCVAEMAERFNVAPSEQTQALFEKLINPL